MAEKLEYIIKNGTVVTSTNTQKVDILIKNGKIAALANEFNDDMFQTINANGMYILPGGVDPHVHLHLPTPAGYSSDDFHSGSIAALYGGTTTIIDFVTPHRGQPLTEALAARIEEANECLTDYSFHVSPVDWRRESEDEIKRCIDLGFTSFKIYMAYLDTNGLHNTDIQRVMGVVGRNGGMVTAHCELGEEVDRLRDSFYRQGKTQPIYHQLSRPPQVEVKAVERAIAMAQQANCPLYVVHLSAGSSLEPVHRARAAGQKVYAETCPQYLLLNSSCYTDDFWPAAKYVISPPLRSPSDQEQLWKGIQDEDIQTVGTDHCPFSSSQKAYGINDFRKIPNGAGGIEHRLALLYTYGVLEGNISINRMVDLFSTQPAKIFGLYPQKGEIAVGSDADLVIWNPAPTSTIQASSHHSQADFNIYEGMKVKGGANFVICHGRVAFANGIEQPELPKGNLLRRKAQG